MQKHDKHMQQDVYLSDHAYGVIALVTMVTSLQTLMFF